MIMMRHVRLTQQHLVSQDVLGDPDAPVQVEDSVRGHGGDD